MKLKILKVYPEIDNVNRYNYQINYGIWDKIHGDSVILENFDKNLDNYDVIFLPRYERWYRPEYSIELLNLLNKIKSHKIKKILFDNDSCYRTFNHEFYNDIDYIFYRCKDKNNNKPKVGSWLPWSIDTKLYTPYYGGDGVLFNLAVGNKYPLRKEIEKIIILTKYKNEEYIKHIQLSAGAIHTDSEIVPLVRGKILEFAACGTQIISNRIKNMNYYFPDELITYFDTIEELKEVIENFQPNIKIQKELRYITKTKHDDEIRAKEVLKIIETIL